MLDIVQQALSSEQSLTRLLQEIEPFVYRLAYYLTRHQQDAEDIAQDVLYKVCSKLSSYRGDSSLQTWVYALVVNTHRDFLRRKQLRTAEPLPDALSTQSFEEASDLRIMLDKVLCNLPDMDRQILTLRFQSGLSVREVAQIMNMSEANVKTRVFRLKNHLRALISQGGEA